MTLQSLLIDKQDDNKASKTRMVVHGQLVEPAVCLSDLYDVFLLDIVRDTRQNLWTMAGDRGELEQVIFFTKNPNLKKKFFWFFFLGGGGGGVDGWTDEKAQTNLPLQLLRCWGHNNALMYKLCP